MDEQGAAVKYQRAEMYFMGCGKRDRPHGRPIRNIFRNARGRPRLTWN